MLQLINSDADSLTYDSNGVEQYIPLVEFLGQAMGPNAEIVLHDLDVPDKSIIAIANGHISGRQVGGPVTDFALWFMKQGDASKVPMMTGYRAVNAEGRICRSSSYFIRDEDRDMRGMLCINVDITDLVSIRDAASLLIDGTDRAPDKSLAHFATHTSSSTAPAAATATAPDTRTSADAPADHPHGDSEVVTESLRSNVQNLLGSMLDTALSKHDVDIDHMRRDDRVEVVRLLEEAGFFLLKGGINAAAERLGVSEPTIYRYLVQVRE